MSVVIGDLTPINRATMVVTIYHYSPLTIGRSAARYAVNPDFSGVVHDLGVVGGSQRDLVYSRVAGPAAGDGSGGRGFGGWCRWWRDWRRGAGWRRCLRCGMRFMGRLSGFR